MNIVLLEILLWAGLLYFFWSLRENLGKIEEIIDDPARQQAAKLAKNQALDPYCKADQLVEPIAAYMGHTIHQYAFSGGRRYRFDCILSRDEMLPPHAVTSGVRSLILAPGLLYMECPRAS